MKILKYVVDFFESIKYAKKLRHKTELELMIEKADQLHRETGKRYHVLPKSNGSLAVVDNQILKVYNKNIKKKGGKQISIQDLLQISYYSTK